MKRLILLSLLVLTITGSLLGCNAFRGAGTDIKNTGENIEEVGE